MDTHVEFMTEARRCVCNAAAPPGIPRGASPPARTHGEMLAPRSPPDSNHLRFKQGFITHSCQVVFTRRKSQENKVD